MKCTPYNILGLSDSPITYSGYANQTRGIFRNLAKRQEFDVTLIGQNYAGMPMHVDHERDTLSSCPQNDLYRLVPGGPEPFGKAFLQKHIQDHRPELLWTLLDTFMLFWLLDQPISPAKHMCYFPSDGTPFPRQNDKYNAVRLLKRAEFPISMSQFGRDQAIDQGVSNCGHIPHAVDLKNFYARSDDGRKALRADWSNRIGVDLTNKFVVGTVGRFQGRKMLPELIKSFDDFSKGKEAVLVIHADVNDPAGKQMGIMIQDFIRQNNVADRVFFTGTSVDAGFTERHMGELYNIFDLFALCTSGEGFGIPTVEAMACEVPVVATDYTTTKELVLDSKAGLAAKVAETITGTYNVERAIADKKDFTAKLQEMFDDRSFRAQCGRNGRKAVVDKYSWDIVMPQWIKAIREAVA
jgi:glycosyltransferase involved in cell wall biosynthesis